MPQDSINHKGGYGAIFKSAMDKNAVFLHDINHFKHSTMLLISQAGRAPNTLPLCFKWIENILKKHSDIENYRGAIQHVLDEKKIVLFSRPSDEAEPGTEYSPPEWNADQKNSIIAMLNALPHTEVPSKDFFQIASSPAVEITMQNALDIVIKRAAEVFKDTINANARPSIYAVELPCFVQLLNRLRQATESDFSSFCKNLEFNNFFTIALPKAEL